MFLQKFAHVVNLFFQWWLTSDQILFRHFLRHEAMFFALGIGLGINLWGVFVLYIPINFLVPKAKIEELRSYLKNRFPLIKRHLKRVEDFRKDFENDQSNLLTSRESRDKAISRLIETYEYDYLFVFGLSFLPVPFLGTIMTGGAIFAIEALEIQYGLAVILFAKIVKVFALASVAYFAYFL